MDQTPGPAIPRSLLICLAASLAGHAAVLVLVSRSEVSEPYTEPVDRTLLVELGQSSPDYDSLDERELIEEEPEAALSEEPELAASMADAIVEPSRQDTSEFHGRYTELRLNPLDLRRFVKSYQSNEDQLDSLPFRPELGHGLEARKAEQRRVAQVDENRAARFGHSAEIVNADGEMTKIGDNCYITSLPAISIHRGQQVSQVKCPGKVAWWMRSELNEVAAFRGIP